MVAAATTVNTSSSVPMPPGRAMNTSERAIISSLRSVRSEHGMCTSMWALVWPRSSTRTGTTPVTLAPALRAAPATHSMSPMSVPPNTSEWPLRPMIRPNSSAAR